MKKTLLAIIILILIALGVVFAINHMLLPKTKADTITSTKIVISPALAIDFKTRLRGNYTFVEDIGSANILITDKTQDIPNNWNKIVLIDQNIDLMPVGFGKFFQGDLPGTGLKVFLATKTIDEMKKLEPVLKDSLIKNPPKATTILAVGDIMLSRDVDTKMDQFGRLYPFENTVELTKNADFSIANLESPFRDGVSVPEPMVFGAEKASVEGLVAGGFDAVNLANNHFGNQDQKGMITTFNTLKDKKIDYFGAGLNNVDAAKPLIEDINGRKIAFLGYTDIDVIPNSYIANQNSSGVNIMNIDNLKTDLKNARKKADFVIVSMHAGYEYTNSPSQRQRDFAHAAIDSGADLVIGHHPHVVQGVEFYKGKFIDYSLGNFIFDQPWSTETQQGLVAKFSLTFNHITKIELTPIHIYNWSQPKVITDQTEFEAIFSRIFAGSSRLK